MRGQHMNPSVVGDVLPLLGPWELHGGRHGARRGQWRWQTGVTLWAGSSEPAVSFRAPTGLCRGLSPCNGVPSWPPGLL